MTLDRVVTAVTFAITGAVLSVVVLVLSVVVVVVVVVVVLLSHSKNGSSSQEMMLRLGQEISKMNKTFFIFSSIPKVKYYCFGVFYKNWGFYLKVLGEGVI